ncbi:hypothetical protein GmHk_02G004628 [Glycine max]|nr:hypothetical protein GmHk_02G004628 [Glycine max]
MKTGWFSCFVCQSFNFFVFLSLRGCASPAIFYFYLQISWIQVRFLAWFSLIRFFYVFFFYLYLHLYLRFLSHKASIFISKLHVHRFIFLLGFPSSDSSMFSFFTSICICMRFFISVFCFFTACSLFLLKLRFLCQKASIFISKLHVHRFVFLLSLSKLKFFCVPELSRSWFPPFSFNFFCVPQSSPSLLSLGFLACWVQICVFFLPLFSFVCIFYFVFFVFHCMFIVSSKRVRVL